MFPFLDFSGAARYFPARNGVPCNMFFWRRHKVRRHQVPTRYALRGRGTISTEDRKAEESMSKAQAQHLLILLDQQLKRFAKEDNDAIQSQPRGRR